MKLRCHLKDGVIVDHHIKVENTGVRFDLIAHNPTKKTSQAHWAQPCIRVGEFTGHGKNITDDKYAYIKKCFVLDIMLCSKKCGIESNIYSVFCV